MSEIIVNKISPRTACGTVTLGDSGDTIALGTGASQTGFGRTGTLDWQTTVKTGDFTAANGEGYFVDTSSGAVTMTLPASPIAANIVSVKDYAYNFGTTALTVARNGQDIFNIAQDLTVNTEHAAFALVFTGATNGWKQLTGNNLKGNDFLFFAENKKTVKNYIVKDKDGRDTSI